MSSGKPRALEYKGSRRNLEGLVCCGSGLSVVFPMPRARSDVKCMGC